MNFKIWSEMDDLEDEHMFLGNASTYLAPESVIYQKTVILMCTTRGRECQDYEIDYQLLNKHSPQWTYIQ
jgi:hypothetical protein